MVSRARKDSERTSQDWVKLPQQVPVKFGSNFKGTTRKMLQLQMEERDPVTIKLSTVSPAPTHPPHIFCLPSLSGQCTCKAVSASGFSSIPPSHGPPERSFYSTHNCIAPMSPKVSVRKESSPHQVHMPHNLNHSLVSTSQSQSVP